MQGLRVGMVSLGCPKNQVDAEMLLASFQQAGCEIVNEAGLADVVVINTCGFIADAKRESIENILEFCSLKEEGRIQKVVVTGCLAERYRDEMVKEIPEADVIVGIGKNADIVSLVERSFTGEKVSAYGDKRALPLSGQRVLTTLPFFAYVKIAEGCSNCCTYCAIPSIRGPYRSRPFEEIVEEARHLAKNGVTEIVLVAQDTTRYGEDLYTGRGLPELLEELAKIDGLHWIRTLYNYPDRITDRLIDVVAANEKVVSYFDIPLQHCSDTVLRAMNRNGDRRLIETVLAKIRAKIPNVTLRTTLIAGFPGETEEQFEELCEFVREQRFERLGCFAYSAEEGTPAAAFEGQLDDEVKQRRADLIMQEQSRILDGMAETLIGSRQEVVVEGYDRYAGCFYGRTRMDAPDIDLKVFFTAEGSLSMGQYTYIEVDETVDGDLYGHVLHAQ